MAAPSQCRTKDFLVSFTVRRRSSGLHGWKPAHHALAKPISTEADAFDRFLIATDTPTGSGIMPLGMMYTMSHLASLGDLPPEMAIAAATGNNARVYRLNSGS